MQDLPLRKAATAASGRLGEPALRAGLSLDQKLAVLMSMATDDYDGAGLPPRLRHTKDVGALRPLNIRNVRAGAGRRTALLRILMTNACSFNCHYCPMRRDREMPRTLLKPEELVRIFLGARARGWCEGLFITTGIPGRPVKVIDDLITVLELLRVRHRFDGYVHVKMPPGGEAGQIERLTALASRVSINLETPCGATLSEIAPEKSLPTTLVSLERVRRQVNAARELERDGRPRNARRPEGTAGMTMQFVVGATADDDRAILSRVTSLYAGGGIHHAHFSAFRPIRDTPMEHVRATPALREHRLYQVDYLVRQYGFAGEEIVFGADGNLPLAHDPKTAWALAHPERFPVEVRTASFEELLRVPGVGPGSARRIVRERTSTRVRDLADLRRFGVVTTRAVGFVSVGGRRLARERYAEQLGFWRAEEDVGAAVRAYEVSPGTFR
ncbi:MAG TPA: radical SAM protein [Gemmatimonadaceae bacterium]|jgi:predicted DNA-binding helix-hairpin-helix protein|nr:radical SAM protein [Gemmatimonadaceae bacterium]